MCFFSTKTMRIMSHNFVPGSARCSSASCLFSIFIILYKQRTCRHVNDQGRRGNGRGHHLLQLYCNMLADITTIYIPSRAKQVRMSCLTLLYLCTAAMQNKPISWTLGYILKHRVQESNNHSIFEHL